MSEAKPFPLKLAGNYGSPYSMKMRAVLRYRQIPFTWVPRDSKWDDMPSVPVRLIPVIAFPDADGNYNESMIDSSPLIARLEGMYTERSLVPTDPVVAFLDYLIEDYGDEWVTKQMFHYRWYFADAIEKAGSLLPLDSNTQLPEKVWQSGKKYITERQIGRMALVGSTPENASIIEDSYVRLLEIMQAQLAEMPFFLGERPGRGDLGVFGQLSQLVAWDPVSAKLAVEHAPRVSSWVMRVDDLSWWHVNGNDGWVSRDAIPVGTSALLAEIGRTYAPFMVANAQALQSGAQETVCVIDGKEHRQGPFPYQGKCLMWLREEYTNLSSDDRSAVDSILAGTGCEQLLA